MREDNNNLQLLSANYWIGMKARAIVIINYIPVMCCKHSYVGNVTTILYTQRVQSLGKLVMTYNVNQPAQWN